MLKEVVRLHTAVLENVEDMQAVIDVELEGHANFLRARVLALANGTLSLTALFVFLI